MIKTLFVLLLIELCNEKEVIPNAEILIQRNASSYTRNIVCDEGYEAVGYNEQRCTDGGHWTPIFQECRSKSHANLLCVHLSMLSFILCLQKYAIKLILLVEKSICLNHQVF